jgi:hypothetical protein
VVAKLEKALKSPVPQKGPDQVKYRTGLLEIVAAAKGGPAPAQPSGSPKDPALDAV